MGGSWPFVEPDPDFLAGAPMLEFVDTQPLPHDEIVSFPKHRRFIPIAQAFAGMSRMPGTKVGAVVLGSQYEVLAQGWNGAPRGSGADEPGDTRLEDRDQRLAWVCHAEANTIANAARIGARLAGGVMVVTKMPCMTCAKLIVQSGIVAVICPDATDPRWQADDLRARTLFAEVGVTLSFYNPEDYQ